MDPNDPNAGGDPNAGVDPNDPNADGDPNAGVDPGGDPKLWTQMIQSYRWCRTYGNAGIQSFVQMN